MRKVNFLHPVAVFIFSLVALGVSLYLYIDSYLRVNETLIQFIRNSGLPQGNLKSPESWVMILTLSILVTLIVVGMSLVFIYYQKVIMLYRMQQNFINGFTHELKTPIASLRIFIDTFRKHELPREKQIEILSLMKKDTDRMQENVEQILNLAKIEDKSFKPDLKEICVSKAFKDFLEKQEHSFDEGEIIVSWPSNSNYIWFDTKLLEILFMNILTNAFRYNHSSKKKVEVSFSVIGGEIDISFKDNGIGIKKEHLKNIFKKFYQVARSVKGSGLGLYMVSQILKVHKGRAWVHSNGLNQGSVFHLVFKKGQIL